MGCFLSKFPSAHIQVLYLMFGRCTNQQYPTMLSKTNENRKTDKLKTWKHAGNFTQPMFVLQVPWSLWIRCLNLLAGKKNSTCIFFSCKSPFHTGFFSTGIGTRTWHFWSISWQWYLLLVTYLFCSTGKLY